MDGERSAALRAALVRSLEDRRVVRDPRIAAALTNVPRERFVEDLPLEDVYADRAIAIKTCDGVATSASSQPAMMAEMLEMLALERGERVLEIGTGSGYNAALLAELTGPEGCVVTIELDEDLAAAARARLGDRVTVVCGDGARGDPSRAPFDALIVTAAVDAIPAAWASQLRPGGRLVVPLAIRSLQKVIAFRRTPQSLVGEAIVDAAFMPLRGQPSGAELQAVVLPGTDALLHVVNGACVEPAALARALRRPAVDVRPAQRLAADEAIRGFALWLALRDDGFCRLSERAADGLVPDLLRDACSGGYPSTLGLCRGGEIAIVALLPGGEIAFRSYGSTNGALQRLQAQTVAWHRAGRPGNGRLQVEVDARPGLGDPRCPTVRLE